MSPAHHLDRPRLNLTSTTSFQSLPSIQSQSSAVERTMMVQTELCLPAPLFVHNLKNTVEAGAEAKPCSAVCKQKSVAYDKSTCWGGHTCCMC